MKGRTGRVSQGIVSWPEGERPRERLLSRGPQALTDAELVAILIRVGLRGTSAVELGRQILKRFGSLRAMVEAPVLALLEVKGLKGAKASQLVAAMEIARRVAVPRDRKQLQIKSTSAAADYLRGRKSSLSRIALQDDPATATKIAVRSFGDGSIDIQSMPDTVMI